jgi:hypothetical protein
MPASTSRRLISAAFCWAGPARARPEAAVGDGDTGGNRDPVKGSRRRSAVQAPNLDGFGGAAQQLVDRSLADDLAAVHDCHLVAGALYLVQQERAQHHRATLVDETPYQVTHLMDARRVQAVHRLIQDQ